MHQRIPLLALAFTASCSGEGSRSPTDGGLPDLGAPVSYVAPTCIGVPTSPPVTTCSPLSSDYAPGAVDGWPACISDDDTYHRIDPTIGALGRVAAFEQIAALLFDPMRDPTSDDFLMARLIYQQDEGLDSRMVRRYDPHFSAPAGTDCTQPGVPAAFPDYCVGPAVLQPTILAALNAGISGSPEPARVHAARIEAALLWFFTVSVYKESLTCTTTAKDCDSSYAKYTGGAVTRSDTPLGLSRYVHAVDAAAHERTWDGLLAQRCWRDLDPSAPATDLARRDQARAQTDRALSDGVAAVLRSRLVALCAASGAEVGAHWASVQILGSLLDRAMTAADPTMAATLRMELTRADPATIDVAAAVDALDAVFTCP